MATMPTTTAAPASLSRDETSRLFGQTMGLVAITAGLFALGAYIGRNIAGGWRSSRSSPPSPYCSG